MKYSKKNTSNGKCAAFSGESWRPNFADPLNWKVINDLPFYKISGPQHISIKGYTSKNKHVQTYLNTRFRNILNLWGIIDWFQTPCSPRIEDEQETVFVTNDLWNSVGWYSKKQGVTTWISK